MSKWAGTVSWNSPFIINSDSRCFKYQENVFHLETKMYINCKYLCFSRFPVAPFESCGPSYFWLFPSKGEPDCLGSQQQRTNFANYSIVLSSTSCLFVQAKLSRMNLFEQISLLIIPVSLNIALSAPMDYLPTAPMVGVSYSFLADKDSAALMKNLRLVTTSDKMKPLSDPPEIFLFNGCQIKRKKKRYFPSFCKK